MIRQLFAIALTLLICSPPLRAAERPNVLIILADDLGYSDLGCYGSEIETPNLDALAAGGLRFTNFYNTARCWPTRAALLTGYYAQQIRRDAVPGVKSGGQGVRPVWAPLLPEILRHLGYRSYHSGKWHIDGEALEGGFDRSYLLRDEGRFFGPRVHFEDDRELPPVEPDGGYYSTVSVADHAIRFLKEHAAQHADRPFFQYVAFTAPHFPLHALPEDIAKYRGKYKQGWDAAREQRWQRIQKLGIASGNLSDVEREVGPPYHFPEALETLGPGEVNRPIPWGELTEEQREFQADKMAIHAAMVDRMDREIGRLLDQLRDMKALENTLILFLSDNGASAEIMVRGDGHNPNAPRGSAMTHLCLGPGWSTVANTPFRLHKTWVHEGGIATPLIVHWPRGIKKQGELRENPGHVIDIVPTVLEIAGSEKPKEWDGVQVPPALGKSLVQAFDSDGSVKHNDLWWLHEGNRAIRVGEWKLVAAKDQPWELFDLGSDRTESNDLAAKHPDKVRELEQQWDRHHEEFIQLAQADLQKEQTEKKAKPVKQLILPGESFLLSDRPAFILWPAKKKRSDPQPWIFYAPTLPAYPDEHEKWMHEQFLAAGVAVAGIDVGEAYGSPAGQELFTKFYNAMIKRGLAKKPCMLGRSRGGLWVTSWAGRNTDKVAGIAGIYPVFDFRTYPKLANAAPAYEMTAEQLQAKLAEHNPIEQANALAKAGVPALFIHGDQDEVVPLAENSAEFVKRYKAAGADDKVTLIVVEGQGHNFWQGFFRCQALVDFSIERAKAGAKE